MYDMKLNGERLSAYRGGKKQIEVAKALNINVSTLSMYESGQRNPRDEIKIALAHYYGTTVEQLFYAPKSHI